LLEFVGRVLIRPSSILNQIIGGITMTVKSSNMLKLLLFFLCTFVLLTGCISSGPPKGAKTDIWVGEITGMAKGKIRITSWQAGENNNDQIIQGQLIINVGQASGGHGGTRLKSSFRGWIKNGLMKVKISGNVEGATFMGEFIGTMSERHGSGTWSVDVPDEDAGHYTGEWTLQKQ
jgi:hypothetical protein